MILNNETPKICVPLVAKTADEAVEQIKRLAAKQPDIIEVRLDYFEGNINSWRYMDETPTITRNDIVPILQTLKAEVPDFPLLATVRTKEQGGAHSMYTGEVNVWLGKIIESGLTPLMDIEWTFPMRKKHISNAREKGIQTVISYHDFEKTPPKAELLRIMREMSETGGDVVKIAVMPRTPEDCLNLLAATYEAKQTFMQDKLIATMAMGALGSYTRLAAPLYGSCMTFAVGEEASAPGQVEIDTVRRLWQNWGIYR
jgi:3-dehydroquinate dehydratase I